MQLKIKKFFNNYIRSLQFTKNLLIQLNILEEFKQISKYIQKSVLSFKLVWTQLKLYFKFYSLWFFVWKKLCLFYNIKEGFIHFLKIRYYFLFNKFKWCFMFYKNLLIPSMLLSYRVLQNQCMVRLILFIIEPLFEVGFKFFIFGYRPFHTLQLSLCFLIKNLKKYNLIWILYANLIFLIKNIQDAVLVPYILTRIWDSFLVFFIKSRVSIFRDSFCIYDHSFLEGIEKVCLLTSFFNNIYFDFFDCFFVSLLFIYIKKENFQYSIFFIYNFRLNFFWYLNFKYLFICFIFYYYKKDFLKGIIKYLRICYTVFFCTSYTFLFILILKDKFINYFNFKFFLNFDFGSFFKIKNVYHGLYFFGFCIKKKLFFFELYIEKKMVIRYLNFKGFCNKIGLPISYIKYISWAQFNLNSKLNFLSKLLSIWWFKGKNKNKIITFFKYIIRYSVSKVYSIKYKKSFLFNFGCGDFKVLF